MAVDLLPFYGMALSTLGGLIVAWANVVKLREVSERRYQWVIVVGVLFILGGFLLQSVFILGKIYPANVLIVQYAEAIIIPIIAFISTWALIKYKKSK